MLTSDQIADIRTDLLEFIKHMFKARKGVDLVEAPFHHELCATLEKVVTGQITRLIINVPPRSGKTEVAVKNFITWCMGNFPDSEFIHASYSKTLAASNTAEVVVSHLRARSIKLSPSLNLYVFAILPSLFKISVSC